MSNIIYILSMGAAAVWLIGYSVLDNMFPAIHLLLVVAFLGTLASLLMKDEKSTPTIKNN